MGDEETEYKISLKGDDESFTKFIVQVDHFFKKGKKEYKKSFFSR